MMKDQVWTIVQPTVLAENVDITLPFSSVHSFSRVRLFETPCCSSPGLPDHHHLPEFTQTQIHWVSDAIQPSHPLSSLSPPALDLSQHQGLFKWVSSPHQVAKVLEFQLQHQSFQGTHRTDLLLDGLVGSPFSPRHSILLCSTFLVVQLSHPYMTTGKTIA